MHIAAGARRHNSINSSSNGSLPVSSLPNYERSTRSSLVYELPMSTINETTTDTNPDPEEKK